jgi:hypothetical protein
MKRTIITIIFFLNIMPCFNAAKEAWQFPFMEHAQAQIDCPGNVLGTGNPSAFVQWLSDVYKDVSTAVSNLITSIFTSSDNDTTDNNNPPNDDESMGSESDGGGGDPVWDDTDDNSYDPGDDGGGPNGEVMQEVNYLYNLYQQGDTSTSAPPPAMPPHYYITVNSNSYIYNNNAPIYVPLSSTPDTLKLHNSNGTVNPAGLTWYRNDTSKCQTVINCVYSVNVVGQTTERVDSAGVKTLIMNPLIVYDTTKPIIFFQRKTYYNSGYGFDDIGYQYDSLKNDYQTLNVYNTTLYNVPWMSLLDGQEDTININTVGLGKSNINDPNFWVSFRSMNPSIKINEGDSLHCTGSTLNSLKTLRIKANQWDPVSADFSQAAVYALDNKGDTIGKLNVSCQMPITKHIVLVYVNTGNGNRNYNASGFIDSLNTYAHNQIFRKWILDTVLATSKTTGRTYQINGVDTINATSEFAAKTATFMDAGMLLDYVDTLYKNHKGIDILQDIDSNNLLLNSPARVGFVFLFNYALPFVNGSRTDGDTRTGTVSVLFSPCYWQTIAHEMGHLIGLKHTFPGTRTRSNGTVVSTPGLGIPEYTTPNFMDYSPPGPDPANMFFRRQWLEVY